MPLSASGSVCVLRDDMSCSQKLELLPGNCTCTSDPDASASRLLLTPLRGLRPAHPLRSCGPKLDARRSSDSELGSKPKDSELLVLRGCFVGGLSDGEGGGGEALRGDTGLGDRLISPDAMAQRERK